MYLAVVPVLVNASMGLIMGAALFYGGAVYLEYRNGNNFGALTFCSYGAFWLTFERLYVSTFIFLQGYKKESILNNPMGVFPCRDHFYDINP